VPGSYASGTAGHALGRLGVATVEVTAPVATNGDTTIIQGDAYDSADGSQLRYRWANVEGRDITGATVKWSAADVEVAGTVQVATGAELEVWVNLSAANTTAFTVDGSRVVHPFDVTLTPQGSTRPFTPVRGHLSVLKKIGT
jgi:hypothetical protein